MLLVSTVLGAALLPPPRVVGATSSGIELLVPVSLTLDVAIFEANIEQQADLVATALDTATPAGSAAEDPYGVVIWPAAQVVAAELVRVLEGYRQCRVLELGAGTGLCSIAAAASGAVTLATDYRDEPLALLRYSAQRTAQRLGDATDLPMLKTQRFDVTSTSTPLPDIAGNGPLIVCAADLLYLPSTSVALAARCCEALRLPDVEAVLVGDLGRPGRAAFLEELVRLGVRKEMACFEAVPGWGAPAPRHELISSRRTGGTGAEPEEVSVGLLVLSPADLQDERDYC
uniref:Calmodulin-lysine N-methyltransferase n=1 Tax=Haptolina brevifila TaxID=156173 RepID=A0A7S2D372_9EUKA